MVEYSFGEWSLPLESLPIISIVIGALTAALVNWFLEGRKFKREQRIAFLKEKRDKFYSPLIFHFENMKSWAAWLRGPQNYAFSQQELERKLEDMYQIMRSGMGLASPEVAKLWYEWQPTAVPTHPSWQPEEFLKRSEKLHQALMDDFKKLQKQYSREIGLKE